MNRVFEIQIIQPKFDELYKKHEKMFVEEKSIPPAIKAGKLKDPRITDNISVGMRLLEANEIEGGSIKRNKTFLPDNSHIENWEIIGRDKIEQYGDKNKAEVKNIKPKKESWLKQIIIGVIIGIIILLIGVFLK